MSDTSKPSNHPATATPSTTPSPTTSTSRPLPYPFLRNFPQGSPEPQLHARPHAPRLRSPQRPTPEAPPRLTTSHSSVVAACLQIVYTSRVRLSTRSPNARRLASAPAARTPPALDPVRAGPAPRPSSPSSDGRPPPPARPAPIRATPSDICPPSPRLPANPVQPRPTHPAPRPRSGRANVHPVVVLHCAPVPAK